MIEKYMNEQAQRIISIMQDKRMSPAQFSEAIGIQRAAMSHITNGRNNPSADVLTKIIENFVDINPGWLLTGKGTMKNDGTNTQSTKNQAAIQTQNQAVNQAQNRATADLFQQTAKNMSRNAEATPKIQERETIVYKERPVKTIEKLVIFFSDHTYETFTPEVK